MWSFFFIVFWVLFIENLQEVQIYLGLGGVSFQFFMEAACLCAVLVSGEEYSEQLGACSCPSSVMDSQAQGTLAI